eukprot:TRINITY_DN4877_c0_g1_i1.p1 TRINITY_DN4877_c0_g1~~TRINITY_DN4877_c0_g1_i1.p1  ORF type:complete len:1025 (+),score=160.28 TRINITY_DN4877_c0_g1_i1:29-3076(+)
MGCTSSKKDDKKDKRSEAPTDPPERPGRPPTRPPPVGSGKDKAPKGSKAIPGPPPFSKGTAAAAASMTKSNLEADSQSQILKNAAAAAVEAATAGGQLHPNPRMVNGLSIAISVFAATVATAIAGEAAQARVEKKLKKEIEEQERRFAQEEREAAVLRRVESMERRAEEATRKLEAAQRKLNKSDSSFKSVSNSDSSSSSSSSPQRSRLYSESPRRSRSPSQSNDPNTTIIELRQGLGVYTIEEQLQPPGTGTRFSVKNTTDFTAAVSLSFVGSKNLEFQIPESSAVRGVTHTTIEPPDGVEVAGETGPSDQLTLCIVKPANLYAHFTVCVQSKWQLLADKDLEKPASNRVMVSKDADDHVYSPPRRSVSRSPGYDAFGSSSCDVKAAGKELQKLRQKGNHGDGLAGTAIKYNMPYVDPDYYPDPEVERYTQRRTTSWQRAEKVYRKANKHSTDTLAQMLHPRPCEFNPTGEAMRWVIMGICALLDQSPDALHSLYPCLVNPDDRSDALQKVGAVDSWWCTNGWWVKHTLDTYIPVDGGLPSLVVSPEVWPSLILKAYSRSKGGFNNIQHGTVGHFLQDATGCPYKRIPFTFATEECNGCEPPDEGESDLANLWETIREHLSLRHIVVVNTREHSASELTWRGDCDIEIEDAASPPLWAFPPDTSLPIMEIKEDSQEIRNSSVKLRNRWGWPLEINDTRIDKSDRWVSYSDLLNGFSSLTVCFLSPGWNDVRTKIHAKAQLDTYIELFITSQAQLQLWLGSATHNKSLMGLLVLEPSSDNRYGNYKSHTLLGIERSSQIWGEVTLEKAASPYLIIPLLYRDPDEFGSAEVYNNVDEYILSIRSNESAQGKAVFKQSSPHLVTQAEIAAILQGGDSKIVAEDKSGHTVTIKLLQQYRWLGCAVLNSTSSAVQLNVNFSGSEGYVIQKLDKQVTREQNGSFTLVVPPRTTTFLCSMVSSADTWCHALQAVCLWVRSSEVLQTATPMETCINTGSYPSIYKEAQLNGLTSRTNQVSLS